MKKFALMVAGLLAIGGAAYAADDFEFHGYARAGVLLNSGMKQVGDVNKGLTGRLGNEGDAPYMESEFVKKITGENGSWAKIHLLFANGIGNYGSWTADANGAIKSGDGNKITNFHTRQAYAEMGGLDLAPTATFWAGKAYYGRDDIHITDNYWRDYSGTGAGVKGLMGALDLAMIVGTAGGAMEDGNVTPVTFDARFKIGDSMEIEGALHSAGGNDKLLKDSSEMGFQGAFVYSLGSFYGMAGGFSKVAFQAGTGLGANLGTANPGLATDKDAMSMRVLTFGQGNVGGLEMMPEFTYDYNKANKDADATSKITAVVRPVVKISKNLEIAFEGGMGMESGKNAKGDNVTDSYYKFTVAPTLALDGGFWTRPQLRAFASYVGQSKDNKAKISANGKDESELRLGVQAEAWW